MDEELLYQSLKRLENQEDRAIFREMAKVFGEVVRYSQKEAQRLEEKIDREWKDPLEKRYLYGTVMAKSDAVFADHLFFPMAEEPDVSEQLIGTVFIQMPESKLQTVLNKSCWVLVTTIEGTFRVEARLERATRYRQAVESLRKDFYFNRIFFGTVNLPYADKFADVILVEPTLGDGRQKILEFKLEGAGDKVYYGLIPLWNVRKLLLPCAVFPVPAADTSYFEHEVVFPRQEDGYVLCSDPEISSIFYRDNTILLWSKRELAKKWEVNQIIFPGDKSSAVPHWPITTNKRTMTHSQRQAENAVRIPRTRGEILRILNSYETVSGLCAAGEIEVDTLFVDGEIEAEDKLEIKGRTRVMIHFHAGEDSFIVRDEIRFLLHELGSFFPEYQFEGELC